MPTIQTTPNHTIEDRLLGFKLTKGVRPDLIGTVHAPTNDPRIAPNLPTAAEQRCPGHSGALAGAIKALVAQMQKNRPSDMDEEMLEFVLREAKEIQREES